MKSSNAQASLSARSQSLPVVAIGASAGGLEAFKKLLSALPVKTGLSFVFLQHLAAKHISLLSEILAKATQIPVTEAGQGMELEPDHVYVLPTGTNMTLRDHVLQLTPRLESPGQHLPIDFFMRGLAQEQKNSAVGVILSGTGSDGALGLKLIKAAGGVTFAQDEATAKYPEMPRNAAATGCVDRVLPPEKIAEALAEIGRHGKLSAPRRRSPRSSPRAGTKPLDRIIDLLHAVSGVEFGQYKSTTIERRIARRMSLHQIATAAKYAEYLDAHPTELQSLYQDLLIPVTSFFRDPELFNVLKKRVFPAILRSKSPETPVRIWVPGCSSGQEPYSLAMALLEYLGEADARPQVQIFGSDLSGAAVDKARAGLYPASIANEVSAERLQRFFVNEDGNFRISKTIREMCVFARHDLTSDPPFSQMDLISCRNVLIYMGPVLQRKILPILHYALKPHGFLVLGSSESTSSFSNLFAVTDKTHNVYAKKTAAKTAHFDFVQKPLGRNVAANPPYAQRQKASLGDGSDIQKEADRIVLAKHGPAGVIIDDNLDVLHFRGRTSPFLEPAPGRASLNLLKMVRPEFAAHLRIAIQKVRRSNQPARSKGVDVQRDGLTRRIAFEIIPLKNAAQGQAFLVLFHNVAAKVPPRTTGKQKTGGTSREVAELKRELAAGQEALRSIVEEYEATREQLQTINEEVVSTNEEFQSTNEELQTSKEELQSANEELNTLNDELRSRNAELHQTNADLNNLLQAVGVPVVILGRDLHIRRATAAAQTLLDVRPSDTGRPIGDLRPRVPVEGLEQLIEDVMNSRRAAEREVQDQAGHWYSLRVYPYLAGDGTVDGAALALFDVDVLKTSSEQVQRLKEFGDDIINTVREPLLVLDSSLRVVRANQSFYSKFQLSQDNTENTPLERVGHGEWNVSALRSAMEETLRKGTPFTGIEVVQEFAGIGTKIMLLNGRVVVDGGGRQPSLLLAIEDVTQQRLNTQRLMAAERLAAAGRLAATLAHEINNPLAAVTNILYLLAHLGTLDTTAQDFVNTAEREIARVVHITKSTLGMHKEHGSPEDVEVASVLKEALGVFASQIRSKHIDVNLRIESGQRVRCNPGELRQVLINLISNAIEAMSEGGKLTVHAFDSNEWSAAQRWGMRINIIDNGSGIAREHLSAIFQPFFTTKGAKGTGLGLWVSSGIVDGLGGFLRVRSSVRTEKSGTCVTVFLPSEVSQADRAVRSKQKISNLTRNRGPLL